jgi:hypothetical protein
MAHAASSSALYGLLAEFDSPDQLLSAVRRTTDAGYTKTDAFSPYPIHGMGDALKFKDRRLSPFVLIGGIVGCLAGYGLEYWTQVIAYPLNIGGRPYHAWVNFIPPAFETTILFGSFTAGIAMLVLNGLPRPYHPCFNVPAFERATQDKFFLVIEADDPQFDLQKTREFLGGLHARQVTAVED